MTDEGGHGDRHPGSEPNRSTIREWARKTYLRETMRAEALSPHELKLLDDRLARWTADQQIAGKLPPEAELRAQLPELALEFRSRHETARPILTAEEIVDVDASRGAAAMRDYVEKHPDFAPGMSQVATQYAVSAGLSELDARKMIADRFNRLFGCPVTDYARQHQARLSGSADLLRTDRLFPAELGWDRYEPAFRRLAAHDSKFHVDLEDGVITQKEFREDRKHRDGWVADQTRQGKLPTLAEMGAARISVQDTLLPFQKQVGRQERRRRQGEDGAYWRRVDEVAGYLKGDIEHERSYTASLEHYALNHAGSYARPVDRMKADIESRFTLCYLYSPSEYLEKKVELKWDEPSCGRDKAGDSGNSPDLGPRHTRDGGRKR